MNKLFNKAVLNGTTVMGDGLTYPRIPNVYTGDNKGGYQRGDMMDANAVVEMIKELTDTGKITIEELQNLINEEIQERVEGDQDQQRYTDQKIKDLIGTSPETLDTLKEIADALGEDPDFAANVWNKIAELTTKHNEDVQELQDAITSGFENIDFTPYVKKTDVVTDTTNGLMLASDKVKLDAFEDAEQYTKAINLPDSVISNADMSSDANGITLKYIKDNLIDGGSSEVNLQIPVAKPYVNDGILSSDYAGRIASLPYNIIHSININQRNEKYVEINWQYNTLAGSSSGYGQRISPATTSIAGVMSAADKKKLDNIIKQITLNGVSTTIIDGVVDIPLATYDKSEEGRKVGGLLSNRDKSVLDDIAYIGSGIRFFRNTIYNDSSIDLVYQKANWGSNNYPLTQDSNLNINSATTSKAGVMSASDKVKLDGIEAGAQVNTIESVSVNGTPLEITNKGVNIPNATTEKDGMMSKADKTKLDSLENYTLPAATDTTLGGIKVPKAYKDDGLPFNRPNELEVTEEGNLILKSMGLGDVIKPFGGPLGSNLGLSIYTEYGFVLSGFNLLNVAYLETHQLGVLDKFDFDRFNAKQDALTEIQLNNINNAITSISVNNVEQVNTNGAIDLTIPNASITENGLMSKEDKAKLDSQPTIKANNATGVTDDDYVVIKKSELNSILSRLSALENKA